MAKQPSQQGPLAPRGAPDLQVDFSEIEELSAKLEQLTVKSIPYAVRNTLNDMAFQGRKEWAGQIEKKMTLRNKWTVNSLHVEKVNGSTTQSEHMAATLGSPLEYLARQETGGTKTPQTGRTVPMPTKAAAGQVRGAKRTRPVRRENMLQAIKLRQGASKGHSPEQRNAIAIRMAEKTGGVVLLQRGATQAGLFRVTGQEGNRKVRMLWSLSKPTQEVAQRPTLWPALQDVVRMGPAIMMEAIERQIYLLEIHRGLRAGPVKGSAPRKPKATP